MNKRKFLKNQTGITLIALVITIIVLLILAGISISVLFGENGIIAQSQRAVLETEIARVSEQIGLISSDLAIENSKGGEKKTTARYLLENDYMSGDRYIKTENLLGEETHYGNGNLEDGDVFVIVGDKLVYYNEDREIESEKDIALETIDFVTEWEVNSGDILELPIASGYVGDNSFIVDWGDGSPTEYISDITNEVFSELPKHQYTEAGTYQISISGRCTYFVSHRMSDAQRAKLTKIISWGDIEATEYCFSGCTNLGGDIPSPSTHTFSDYGESFKYLFADTAITSIPGDLFENIPDDVKNFGKMFSYCYSLKEIPEGLFNNCVNATTFEETFKGCELVEKVPTNLFDNCTKVTNFINTFNDMDKVTELPALWTRTTEGLVGTGCYEGCDSLINLGEIPASWK